MRSAGSRSRTRASGWRQELRPKWRQVGDDPRQEGGQAPRKCRRRSPFASVAFQLRENFVQRHPWFGHLRRSDARQERGSQPALSHRVRKDRAPCFSGRADFRYDTIAVCHQDGLAARCHTHILAKPTVEDLDPNRSHRFQGSNKYPDRRFPPRWNLQLGPLPAQLRLRTRAPRSLRRRPCNRAGAGPAVTSSVRCQDRSAAACCPGRSRLRPRTDSASASVTAHAPALGRHPRSTAPRAFGTEHEPGGS